MRIIVWSYLLSLFFLLRFLLVWSGLAWTALWKSGRVSPGKRIIREFILYLYKIKKEIINTIVSFLMLNLRIRYSFCPKTKELFDLFFSIIACFGKRHLLLFRRTQSFLRIHFILTFITLVGKRWQSVWLVLIYISDRLAVCDQALSLNLI